MADTIEIELDNTTHYSILGLTPNATDIEIRKSYMNLARKLHPDKSKSEATGELFKLVVHAHSILTDVEKKRAYDAELLKSGLYDYLSRDNSKSGISPEIHSPKPRRKNKPYEQQPYGFGTEENENNKSSVPIFQSFNLKSYQRTQKYSKKEDTGGQPGRKNKYESMFTVETDFSQPDEPIPNDNIPYTPQKSPIEDDEDDVSRTNSNSPSGLPDSKSDGTPPHSNNTAKRNLNNTVATPENDNGGKGGDAQKVSGRSKLHKVDTSNPFTNQSFSGNNKTFGSHDNRHYARTKYETRENNRRSTSPIKSTPTSHKFTSHWNSLKDIIDKLNQNTHNSKAEKESSVQTEIESDGVSSTVEDPINMDDLSIGGGETRRKKKKVQTEDNTRKERSFDMTNINETIDNIPISKKQRFSQSSENLHEAVNHTLPRFYKSEKVNDDISQDFNNLNIKFPDIPNFQIDLFDIFQLEHCRTEVIIFNDECNNIKEQLLEKYFDRLHSDVKNNVKLMKVENFDFWLKSRKFDLELINKINELEYRQSLVAQTFINLSKSVYSSQV
ncbi:hypothetical protein KAFR_0F01810 [Kazachstania africana CBS 2517]|uniref:J domain-containing protein n=1 Tax=Kazachstania africana (strain ATCC 22294 / BCRC 22015 / CBS 2517 / CECT 1963 / NBRC 1671 / NRRL Y-8276) TaxID=1071382 RepID=H2AWM8_KAZAF|nr:hypothetical protein KAFR_0F01810 [Kazachstania africana CBS 2517]CCF58778.1 hypothetical protein KAFR_0F01810 [Kazachstania africana CBS 2517]